MKTDTQNNRELNGDAGGARLPGVEPHFGADSHPAFLEYPSKMFVELTTRCNLSCHMCVKQSWGNGIEEGDMTRETFMKLVPAFPHLEGLLLNGIGESLLHPQLEEFISIAKEHMPSGSWVGFQSNGLLLDEARAVSLLDAGLDRICLSLDAICPETFRKIREGGEVDDLAQAFNALAAARNLYPDTRIRVGVEFVLMEDNMHQLPEVLRWSASRGADFAIVSHLLPYEAEHVSKTAYDSNTDQALQLFREWKRKADAQGIDMSDYFFIYFCKYKRTEEEERMVAFVHEMMEEARSRDIFLHVKNLLTMDVGKIDRVTGIFAEARAVAEECGLELKLPGVSSKNDRRCDFIEGGGAFVSWDGAVHPCYFLWHRFVCYFSGRKKYVNAKVFGNVSEKGIFDVWNDPVFVDFRSEVLRHEYPFCSNCNLIPCEYIYCEEFEQDCYTNTVPCGDCFWCLGLFNCMQ